MATAPARVVLTAFLTTIAVCTVYYVKNSSTSISFSEVRSVSSQLPGSKNEIIKSAKEVAKTNEEDAEFDRIERKFENLTRHPDISVELRPEAHLNETDELFYKFISHVHYTCSDWVRMGKTGDGGWSVCQAGPYRIFKPCLVYSFGINNDWSFDDAASQTHGCMVRAFDPSMNVEDHVRLGKIYFYKIGFGGSDRVATNGWTMRKLSSLVRQFNDHKTIDYIKFDIEMSEWEVLESFLTDPDIEFLIKYRVRQLALEIHPKYHRSSPTADAFYKQWTLLKALETRFGYRRWWFTVNQFATYQYNGKLRSVAYEMVYINRRFLVPLKNTNWYL